MDKNRLSETAINGISKIETKVFEPKVEKAINEEVEEENLEKEYIKASFAGTFYSGKEEGGSTFVNLYDDVENDVKSWLRGE